MKGEKCRHRRKTTAVLPRCIFCVRGRNSGFTIKRIYLLAMRCSAALAFRLAVLPSEKDYSSQCRGNDGGRRAGYPWVLLPYPTIDFVTSRTLSALTLALFVITLFQRISGRRHCPILPPVTQRRSRVWLVDCRVSTLLPSVVRANIRGAGLAFRDSHARETRSQERQ
jgi:hypothetical protein